MSVAGIKVNDLAKVDLRPSAVKRTYYSTQARVVKYYANMRFFYEMESKVRDIRRVTAPVETAPREHESDKERRKENNTSGRPSKGQDRNSDRNGDRNQDRNYAKDEVQPVVAQTREAEKIRDAAWGDADGNANVWSDAARREA